jgi:Zn-dependent protease with chaperone function
MWTIYLAIAAAAGMLILAGPVAGRLPPARAALLVASAALGAAGVWVVTVGLLAVVLAGQVPLVAAVGRWSAGLVRAGDPVPHATSLAAWAAVLVGVAGAALFGRRLVGETRRWLPVYRHPARAGSLIVLDDPAPAAAAVPGWPGRIVVSSGMLRALSADERRVLLAHEQCHLDSAHWLYRFAVRLAAAVCPLARPLVATCDQALERWADEHAAAVTGDRRLAARAVARAALAGYDHTPAAAAAGFTGGHVSARVQALLEHPPRRRWAPALLPLAVLALAVACTLDAEQHIEVLFEAARHALPPAR